MTAKFRNDGFDQVRMDRAKAKRERKVFKLMVEAVKQMEFDSPTGEVRIFIGGEEMTPEEFTSRYEEYAKRAVVEKLYEIVMENGSRITLSGEPGSPIRGGPNVFEDLDLAIDPEALARYKEQP